MASSSLEQKVRQLLGGEHWPEGGPLHIIVMLVLLTYGDDGHDMRPSGSTLAAETAMSRRQVTRILSQLEAWKFIKATERVDRQPVVWAIGEALTSAPDERHGHAISRKARWRAEHEKPKPEPNPEKKTARAIKTFLRHKPADLVRQDASLLADIVTLPNEIGRFAQEVLDDVRPALPKTGEWRVTPDAVVSKQPYASFAAIDTREDDDDVAA